MIKECPAKHPRPATQPTATTVAVVVASVEEGVAKKVHYGAWKEVGRSRRTKNVPSPQKKKGREYTKAATTPVGSRKECAIRKTERARKGSTTNRSTTTKADADAKTAETTTATKAA